MLALSKNLEDIARLAGVSRSTVSRVINDDPHVGNDTRARVLEIIKQANYQPNMAARGLAAGRTRILGIVIPRGVADLFSDPYFPLLIQAISSACNARDYSVMLWLAEPEHERRMIRKILYSGLIDGAIVACALMDDPLVGAFAEGRLPFILVGRHAGGGAVSYVDIDNVSASRDIVLHLLRLGYRRVATIAGPRNMIPGVDRLEGYVTGLRQRGLVPDPNLIVEGDFTEAGGRAAMQRLLPHAPEAVFAASDMMALGALRALRESGRQVPEDVAVVGFDDMPFAARTDPPLTTVRQPIHRTGVTAAETLIDMLDHPDATPRRIILPTEIAVRESCGAGRRLHLASAQAGPSRKPTYAARR
jgi:LacI family transcriptional regulator